MRKSYISNYIKIYFWQFLAVALNLLSMFIVVPRISSDPPIYGIYSVCISASIFLIYADFGFIGAGYKYASESFAKKDREEEIRVVGFSGFILFFFVVLYALALFLLSLNPQILIKDTTDPLALRTASNLLAILAYTSFGILLQRFMQIVYGIRLEDFIFQRILIIFSLLKIASVVYYFADSKYDIVGYFLFCQIMTVLAGIVSLIIAVKRYGYDFNLLLRSFHFSRKFFLKTKNIAFGTLFSTAMFVLYYELDPFVITRFLGAPQVALYAIGLTLLSYFRAFFGMIYSPFSARFNHFVGLRDEEGLKYIFRRTVILTAPLVIFPIISLILIMKQFVYSWVGARYEPSIIVSQMLIASFIFGFLTYPATIVIIAKEKIRTLYLISALLPFIYWIGIFFTMPTLGIVAFSLFKLVAFVILAAVYFGFFFRYLEGSSVGILKEIIYPGIIPFVVQLSIGLILGQVLPSGKSNANFLFSVLSVCGLSAMAIALYCWFSREHRKLISGLYSKFIALTSLPAAGQAGV